MDSMPLEQEKAFDVASLNSGYCSLTQEVDSH